MLEILSAIRAYPQMLQAIGVFGFMLYVGAFFAIQSGRLCGNGILFPINQVMAATCVLVSLAGAFNLASFLIQVSYIGIGGFGIAVRWWQVRSVRSRSSRSHSDTGSVLASSI